MTSYVDQVWWRLLKNCDLYRVPNKQTDRPTNIPLNEHTCKNFYEILASKNKHISIQWRHMCVPVFRITSNSGSGLFVQQLAETNNIWKIKAPNSRPIVHGNLSVTNGFSSQSASDVESVSISWHRHGMEKLAFFMIAVSPYIGYWQGSLFLFILYHISYRRKFGLIAIKQTEKTNTALKDD